MTGSVTERSTTPDRYEVRWLCPSCDRYPSRAEAEARAKDLGATDGQWYCVRDSFTGVLWSVPPARRDSA